MRLRISILLFGLLSVSTKAQTVSLDLAYFNDYLRDQQLMGRVDTGLSMMIRPLHIAQALENRAVFTSDSLWWMRDKANYSPWSAGKTKGGWTTRLLPMHYRFQYNALWNYGWQNGPMVPNRGVQHYVSAGFSANYKQFLEVQIRPEFVSAENVVVANPPVRHGGIDNPERMGMTPFREFYAGQSYLKFRWKGLSAGISSENLQWGPARHGSIFLSNSAPGFVHLTLHTNKPWKTRIGNFEGQFVGGRLRYSGFAPYGIEGVVNPEKPLEPPRVPDLMPSPLGSREHSRLSAITGTYMPKWLPGLFLGGAFGIQSVNLSPIGGLFAVLLPGNERSNSANFASQNGMLTVFGRYLIPNAGFELYGELGREDWWFDREDLAIDPFHSTVGLLGLAKIKPLGKNDHYLRIETEFTRLMGPLTQISRNPGNSFYTHSNQLGWTHRGQILGVGLPPGSNRQYIGVMWNKGYHRLGLSFERIEYAQDLFYFRMPFLLNTSIGNSLAMDYTKRYVDLVGKLRLQTAWKGLIVGTDVMLLRTFNFQWMRDELQPEVFRFPGLNYMSVNAHLYMYFRL